MRYLLLLAGSTGYGIQRSSLTLARSLENKGEKVRLITVGGGKMASAATEAALQCTRVAEHLEFPTLELQSWRKTVSTVGLLLRYYLSAIFVAVRLEGSFRADVVLVRMHWMLPIAIPLSSITGARVVWLMANPIHRRCGRFIAQLLCSIGLVTVIGNSRYTANTFGSAPNRPRWCHLGLDVSTFPPATETEMAQRRLYRNGALRLGMISRLSAEKGHLQLVRALSYLENMGFDQWVLTIAGGPHSGAYYETLVAEIAQSGLKRKIMLRPFSSDPRSLYRDLDVTLNPHQAIEAFGNSVVEALAMGVPVMAVARGGPGEVIRDGVDGWLLDDGSVESVANGLKRVFAQRDRISNMGRCGRSRVNTLFLDIHFAGRFEHAIGSATAVA